MRFIQRAQGWYEVQCAHCGEVYKGTSQALTWAAAQTCVASHQIKTWPPRPKAVATEPDE